MIKDRLNQEINIDDWVAIVTGMGDEIKVGKVKAFNKTGSPKVQLSHRKTDLVTPNYRMINGYKSMYIKIVPTNQMEIDYENK